MVRICTLACILKISTLSNQCIQMDLSKIHTQTKHECKFLGKNHQNIHVIICNEVRLYFIIRVSELLCVVLIYKCSSQTKKTAGIEIKKIINGF